MYSDDYVTATGLKTCLDANGGKF